MTTTTLLKNIHDTSAILGIADGVWIHIFDDRTVFLTVAALLLILLIIIIFTINIGRKKKIIAEQSKNLQAALSQANEAVLKYRLTSDALNIALWDMDVVDKDPINPDNRITWSQEFLHLLGFSDDKEFPHVLHSWSDRLHPADKERTLLAFHSHLVDRSGKTPFDIEYDLMVKSGEYRTFRAFGTTLRDEDGTPVKVAGALQDVTEKKLLADALQEALFESNRTRDIMTSILNKSDVMIYVTDTDTYEILFVNDIMMEHFKLDAGVIGQPCYKIFQAGQDGRCDFCPCYKLDENPDETVVWEDRNAVTNRYYRKSDQYADWPGGKKVHIQHCVDITDIKETQDELAIQKNTLQTMINSIPDFVFGKNLKSEYTLLNRAAARYLDADVEHVIGKDDIEGLRFPVDVAMIMVAQDSLIFDGLDKFVDEHWIPGHDGSLRYFETTKAPIIQDGNVIGLVGVSRDITEKMQMEKELELALEQANAASKAKGDFLSTMSHEMRTPMNAIIGMTAIGKRSDGVDEKNRALTKIGDASTHLLGVINDILDMAKIEANKLELSPIEYDFERMLQKVINVVNFRAGEKLQTLTVNVDKQIPRFVIGDDQRLAQILTNILSNAIKFTPEYGHIHMAAALAETADETCLLQIMVSDDGIGISAAQQEMLFSAFAQAESGTSREFGGTGLGLVISKRIVEMMGGSIWVESELGEGARFYFTAQVKRGHKCPPSLLAPGVNWDNVRILVVDDMPETRQQFKDIFEQAQIECDIAAGGLEACEMIKERGEYDIYFVDWIMPGMDGVELTRQIKKMAGDRPNVVTMMTAADWEQIKDEAFAAGVDKYMLKPLFSSTIIDCVNECLGTARDMGGSSDITEGEFAGKWMLLAEDVDINREILLGLLENTGLNIDCAENGEEALKMVSMYPDKYDIISMDVQMPKMDGLEAARRIRALPSQRDIHLPIIAMTANVFKDDIEACLAAGMDDHLGKPLDIDVLLEKLRKYLAL